MECVTSPLPSVPLACIQQTRSHLSQPLREKKEQGELEKSVQTLMNSFPSLPVAMAASWEHRFQGPRRSDLHKGQLCWAAAHSPPPPSLLAP